MSWHLRLRFLHFHCCKGRGIALEVMNREFEMLPKARLKQRY